MTKFVILGSCRHEPYDILAVPNKIPGALNTDEGYVKASKIFYPAMDQADVIMVYAPDGIGEHTQKDIDYARSIGKTVFKLVPIADEETESIMEDFNQVYYTMISKLKSKLEKYDHGYRGAVWSKDRQYYLDRIKEEIKEYEEHRSLDEATDIGNFAMMLIRAEIIMYRIGRDAQIFTKGY